MVTEEGGPRSQHCNENAIRRSVTKSTVGTRVERTTRVGNLCYGYVRVVVMVFFVCGRVETKDLVNWSSVQ